MSARLAYAASTPPAAPGAPTYAPVMLPFSGPTADRTLDSPLSFWSAWQIRARCGAAPCPRDRLVCVETLLAERGDMTVRQLADRMRCSHCQGRATTIAFLQQRPSGKIIHPVRRAH